MRDSNRLTPFLGLLTGSASCLPSFANPASLSPDSMTRARKRTASNSGQVSSGSERAAVSRLIAAICSAVIVPTGNLHPLYRISAASPEGAKA